MSSDSYKKTLAFGQSLYLGESVIMVFGNALIILAFATNKKLRRIQLTTMFNLACIDGLLGIGYLTTAVYRLRIIWSDRYMEKVTPWDCMLKPHTIIFKLADIGTVMSVLALSIDRAIAVTSVNYKKYVKKYAIGLVSIVWGFNLTYTSVIFRASYTWHNNKTASVLCYGNSVNPRPYALAHSAMVIGFGFASMLVYFLVCIPALVRKRKKMSTREEDQNNFSREKKLTITFLVVIILTFLTHTVPLTSYWIILKCAKCKEYLMKYTSYLWVLAASNSGNNFFIYMATMAEMRNAILNILTCGKGGNSAGVRSSAINPATSTNKQTRT